MAGPPTWRDVLLQAGLGRGVDGLVAIAADALEQALPILREDDELRDAARRSAAANLELLLVIVQERGDLDGLEPPPAAMAFARELARRHVPVSELGRAYRVAQHAMWLWAVQELRRGIADPAALAVAVEELSDAAFRTGDVFSTLVMERYAAERERWMRSGEAVRAAAVQELLAGGPADVVAVSRRLGYEVRNEHRAFVVWGEAEDAIPQTLAAAVGGPRALVVRIGDGLVAGWGAPGSVDPGAGGQPDAGRTRVAFGGVARGLAGFRSSHHQAMEARRVARLLPLAPGPVHHQDVALLALLTKDLEEARAFTAATLGPLAAPDPAARRLAATLQALLEERGSPRRAGRRLGVHENTVAKRQAVIDRQLPPAARAGPAELLAALALLPVVRA